MAASVHGQPVEPDADSVAADEQALKSVRLGTDGPTLLDFFRNRTLTDADRGRIRLLIKRLGDDDFEVREKAGADLADMGAKCIVPVRAALNDRDVEVVRRAEDILRKLERSGIDTVPTAPSVALAASRLVGIRKPVGAAEVLLAFLPFADEEPLVDEVEMALAAVALRDGKPDPALAAALTSAEPLCRGIAGATLTRVAVADHKIAARKLLKDPDPGVRLRIGLALAGARDKAAIPVLIDVLGELPPDRVWQANNLLYRLAGEDAPTLIQGTDAESKTKYRDAWAAWWRKHGEALELPAETVPQRFLGYTLVVVPDYGQVRELDRNGKLRWQIGGLESPFHAHVLPGNRILIAEFSSGRVTERNLKGDILWQHAVPEALQCQRLPNGNTFVSSIKKLVEIDPTGKERVLYTNTGFETGITTARKLPNGQIVLIENGGGGAQCIRLDVAGKQIGSFTVGRISNNCLEVLPNGHLLVSRKFDNKVTEHDARGRPIWEIPIREPFSAQRLPNGNTLVACYEPCQVVELDRAGKVVWDYQLESGNHHPWFTSRR
jgi:hypothetical protein